MTQCMQVLISQTWSSKISKHLKPHQMLTTCKQCSLHADALVRKWFQLHRRRPDPPQSQDCPCCVYETWGLHHSSVSIRDKGHLSSQMHMPNSPKTISLRYTVTCFEVGMCAIDFFYSGSVSWKTWIRFRMSLVQFGYYHIVMYYSCNSWVVNLQKIFQRQWMTWLWQHWRHSQQWQHVKN